MTRRLWAGGLAGLVLALSVTHLWWLLRFRRGFPLDIDESGYLWYAFVLHDELRAEGVIGLWSRVQGEGWAGPLLPSVTALVQLVWGSKQIIPSIVVQLAFFGVLVVATYGIATRLDRRAGLLAALTVATIPAVTDFTRTYHLVIPSAALYALATYALLASERLRRTGWSVAFGAALGLTLLSRSMMIAFLPALPAAALWIAVVDRAGIRRLANLAAGLVALAATALLWYAKSWRPIFDYLLDFGYGADSPGAAEGVPKLSTEYWTDELVASVNSSLYLPLAVVLLAAFVLAAAGWVAGSRGKPHAWAGQARRVARSDAIVPVFVVLEGYLALTSSRNDGTGFVVPLLPPLVALAVVSALRVPWRSARIGLAAALSVIALFNVAMKADVVSEMSRVRIVSLPGFGEATVANGQGYLHQHLANKLSYAFGPPTRWLPERERGWLSLFERVASHLDGVRTPEPRVYLAQNEPLLNPSALRLAAYRSGRTTGVFAPVDTGGKDTESAYRELLARELPDVLVTTDGAGAGFGPLVTQALVEAAASELGFERIDRLPVPDGRALSVWVPRPDL